MTDRAVHIARAFLRSLRSKIRRGDERVSVIALLAVLCTFLIGCESAPKNTTAIRAYYTYDMPAAREALRGDAYLNNDEQTILDNSRLGLAALADGDTAEAERAFMTVFELLSTAGLNEDRTVAAVFTHEGVRIWKGEPFEQALMYHWIATLYAVEQDWENMRAAAANALFRLTDFGEDQTDRAVLRKAANNEDYLEDGYTAVDTNFALGFLMQAIGTKLSGAAGADDRFDAAMEINPDLVPIVGPLRDGGCNTILIVDYGKGPTKIAHGPDDALSKFVAQEDAVAMLRVEAATGNTHAAFPLVCDVNAMARDMRWNSMEDVRVAKSIIGTGMVVGGAIATDVSLRNDSPEGALIGLAVLGAGLLTKSGAQADVRYNEFAPSSVYIAPIMAQPGEALIVQVESDAGSRIVLDEFQPGTVDNPRVVYLRLHGIDSPDPAWLTDARIEYGNDHTGVRLGDYPWILGGRDVSTLTRDVLAAYQASGYLTGFTINDLLELYQAEGIIIGSGMQVRTDVPRNPSYRHILEGGVGLFTPEPDSIGYKRLMYKVHPPYRPKSERVRNLAEQIRVEHTSGPAPTSVTLSPSIRRGPSS